MQMCLLLTILSLWVAMVQVKSPKNRLRNKHMTKETKLSEECTYHMHLYNYDLACAYLKLHNKPCKDATHNPASKAFKWPMFAPWWKLLSSIRKSQAFIIYKIQGKAMVKTLKKNLWHVPFGVKSHTLLLSLYSSHSNPMFLSKLFFLPPF